jgi:NADPH-dependent glutamate synthase beta subunit-like oxidoreductase/NAD(P)H-flavin reductase
MSYSQLTFHTTAFKQLFQADTLYQLDQQFLAYLKHHDSALHHQLLAYRNGSTTTVSKLILASAPWLEEFIADFFAIQDSLVESRQRNRQDDPILEFKKNFVLRRAKRRLHQPTDAADFTQLNEWLAQAIRGYQSSLLQEIPNLPVSPAELITEIAVAQLAQYYLAHNASYAEEIAQLTNWCVAALTTPDGQAWVHDWISFRLPQPIDHANLVPVIPVTNDPLKRLEAPLSTRRQRYGFKLTDQRMSALQVKNELHYCIYCHDNRTDFCSKGFPEKKTQIAARLKTDPLGNILTGCPLTEKISEMHWLKRQGYLIAPLAVIMIDNPMCPVTGHRICNDCMKACIYQKQEPVNIPQIETRVLTDVLELPWGVEIYDLLTRWNPLRPQQWVPRPYNGLKVLIAGQGPAGFTLAHYLLMEGFAVVGIDGLKIEPLPQSWLEQPLRDYQAIQTKLDQRIITGFGGVAEYGITVRWDKNFLQLIYLSLLRRPYFQIYGNVRFGGTLTVEDVWKMGFDHLTIAAGAALPQALPIPGSLAPGMRQASDFLMALQLTGAAKANSLANLQVRLPAIVIGGGLTAIDTATEVQAYYLVQIERTLSRYEQLIQAWGEAWVREQLDAVALEILDEFLTHAQQLRTERAAAQRAATEPNIQNLLHQWGGVTVVYRRSLPESPAYKRNHEEVIKALEEGIYYLEGIEPQAVRLDNHGQVQGLVGHRRILDAIGQWQTTSDEVILPARAILVATGAQPNIAYEFEHRGHFQRTGWQYQPYHDVEGTLQALPLTPHCKIADFGPFTSYEQDNHRVTFVGDTHPTFQGSVVKAIASSQRTYPAIVKLFADQIATVGNEAEYLDFRTQIQAAFAIKLEQIQRQTPRIIELKVKAPLAARQFRPGQLFRCQNLETLSTIVADTSLQMEAIALRCVSVDREQGTLSLMVVENHTSSRLCATLKVGEPLALMGPTGVNTKIYNGGETVMMIGECTSMAEIRMLGPAWRAAGNRVLYVACVPHAADIYGQDELEAAADVIVWLTKIGEPMPVRRPQDWAATGDFWEQLHHYAKKQLSPNNSLAIPLSDVTQVLVSGDYQLVSRFMQAREGVLREYLTHSPPITVAINGPMQCMLKGICAQCLQWQIDPTTKHRTKAVFACSWQNQPVAIVDLEHLAERSQQNHLQEQFNHLWLDYLLTYHAVERI